MLSPSCFCGQNVGFSIIIQISGWVINAKQHYRDNSCSIPIIPTNRILPICLLIAKKSQCREKFCTDSLLFLINYTFVYRNFLHYSEVCIKECSEIKGFVVTDTVFAYIFYRVNYIIFFKEVVFCIMYYFSVFIGNLE